MSLFVPEQVQQVLCEQPILGAQSHLCFLLRTDKPPISLPIYQAQPLLSASPQPTSSGEGWSTPVNFRQNPDTPEMPYFPFLFFIGQVSVPIPLAELRVSITDVVAIRTVCTSTHWHMLAGSMPRSAEIRSKSQSKSKQIRSKRNLKEGPKTNTSKSE